MLVTRILPSNTRNAGPTHVLHTAAGVLAHAVATLRRFDAMQQRSPGWRWRWRNAAEIELACPEGLEPPTCCLEGSCSIQLSYGQNR